MKRNFIISFCLIAAAALAAGAHPLGNFSINQYSRIEAGVSKIKIRQVLDMAEIPVFQARGVIDADKNGELSRDELNAYAESITPGYIENLSLSARGRAIPLKVESTEIFLEDGEGNLPILKVKWNLYGDIIQGEGANRIEFENKNFPNRIGWNEIVAAPSTGVNIYDSTAFGNAITEELAAYPQDSLTAPLNERTAEFSFAAGAVPDNVRLLQNRDGRKTEPVQKDRFAELISVPEITPIVALFGLLVAFGFGAIHAMSPGHGKAVVGAYLVGSRGTAKHAFFLGLTVTITHTLGVFALGLVTLFASNYVLPERLMPFLGFVSGLLVFFIGISLFKDRLFSLLGWKKDSAGHHHDHSHEHGHEHSHDHEVTHSHDGLTHTHGGTTHSHAVPDEITWKSLLALGISGGLLPCPSALVLMLSAIALDRVGYGLILTVAFSVGLSATLTVVGLVFLNIRNAFGRTALSNSMAFKILPVCSAFVVAFVGAVICYTSLG